MNETTSSAPAGLGFNFDNTYARLPEHFFERTRPVPVAAPRLVILNRALSAELGLDAWALDSALGAAVFAGNSVPQGALPIAQAYAGHQFGHFTMLGDGRAILLGEHVTPHGERFDIQLKGSGRTRFSRRGDGRAALGPMLREYIVSEAMHALGIPTTRSLAVVATGEHVHRETRLPGAILTRVAASHIRVGTFEYAASQGNPEDLRALALYTIDRHFPELREAEDPIPALLASVLARQASLVARWLHVGFIHGVMNTDNMSLCGESIDFGPCAFMDAYDPATVFSSIDHGGRYAYGNQPSIAQWNLTRFAETLLPLLHDSEDQAVEMATAVLETFPAVFRDFWLEGMGAKLGLFGREDGDADLAQALLTLMREEGADYTRTLRDLCRDPLPDTPFFRGEGFKVWHDRWQARLTRQHEPLHVARRLMLARNPAVIPRNHRVEEALEAAENGDMTAMTRLLRALEKPYEDNPAHAAFAAPPATSNAQYRTFCGT
ncbi:protein adenylyltransferase SelO [Desulfomicrobium escambiense]|uniref:protein adenylyltransferase SelO n=1 Tax=Desulfomicrobium escambiense TaxID=29503 RepID=UPI000414B8F1|nr:YdiU family protein [Desulfomicrobium escambiense]